MKTIYLLSGISGIVAFIVSINKYATTEKIEWLLLGAILFIIAIRNLWLLRKRLK